MSAEAYSLMDRVNRRAWRDRATVAQFERLSGWTDPGERGAMAFVADEAKDQPILDIGVGAGRTVPLLRAISRDYTAIDYAPELVHACRRRHPDVRVLHGDARDLSRFPDESFQLVVFSFNGIDAVNPDDRLTILNEARRVLRKGGSFLFSAHNRLGPGHGEKLSLGVYRTRNPLKVAVRVARALVHMGRTLRNYERYSKLNEERDGYSIMNAAAHDHGLLIHYVTLEAQLKQLEAAGFSGTPAVWGNIEPRRLQLGQDTSDIWWFHFVALTHAS